jgi:hypothetical protein
MIGDWLHDTAGKLYSTQPQPHAFGAIRGRFFLEQTMLIITSDEDMGRAATDPLLRTILAGYVQRLADYELPLEDLACFYVCEPTDTDFPGWSPLVDRNGVNFGQAGFSRDWEYLQKHNGHWEIVFILSDDGFGHVVLVNDDPAVTSPLLELCRQYADQ